MTSHSRSRWLVLLYVRVLLLLDSQLSAVHGQDAPTVTLGPALVTRTLEIVSGSNIQLFCSATSTSGVAPDISWSGKGMVLENTPPSIYFRTSSDGTNTTSSVLTIEDFQSADDGTYFCSGSIPANGGSGTVAQSSGTAVLTAVSFGPSDSKAIELNREPISREDRYDVFADNRVSVAVGTQFDPAGTPNPDQMMVASANLAVFRNLKSQSIVWIRDGELIAENGVTPTNGRYTLTATSTDLGGLGQWRTVLVIIGFQAADVGVYQVIFTYSYLFFGFPIGTIRTGYEVLTTTPVRLDTDGAATLARVSPAIIDLVLGEPLLIEVSASGGYTQIFWTRNGTALSGTFVSHDEVYYTAATTSIDIGEYSITAAGGGPTVTVAVFDYTPPTTNIPNATIEVMEDGSADIMCTSTGILTPTIEWELDSSPMPFTPVDVAPVDPVITQVSPLMFDVGSLTSVLPIANAVFPDHQGTYRCTGTNSHAGTDASDDATVLVTVLVTPEVQVTATRTRIQLGGTVTLTCTVTRSNPSGNYMYTWTLLPAMAVSGPTASTQSTDILAVMFDMEDDYGTYRCSVQNNAGLIGTADIVIEQGFLPEVSISGGPATPTTDDTVDLTCLPGNGDSPITYQWVDVADDGVTLSTSAMYTATVSGSVTYRCTATNDLWMDLAEVTVVDASAPAIVDAPENLTVVRPDDATFSCQASGRPRPAITWWRLTSADSGFVQIMMGDPGYSIEETEIGDCDLRSNLTILGTMLGDTGEYLCQAHNIGSSAAESTFLTVQALTTALFQLRLIPVGDCATFVVDSPDQKFQDIISAVVDAVSMMCSCTFTQDNIQNNEFSCRGIENTVVFRAEITYTSFTITAAQLVDFVSQWVQSAPSFVVGPSMSRINVDTNCPTQLDSFLSEDCVSVDQGKTLSIGVIVGGGLAGVCVVFIFTGIIVVVIFVRK